MSFIFDFNYPNNNNPDFKVFKIERGYQFQFFDENGNEEVASRLTIGEDEIKSNYKATGHQGRQGEAIQIFREKFKL